MDHVNLEHFTLKFVTTLDAVNLFTQKIEPKGSATGPAQHHIITGSTKRDLHLLCGVSAKAVTREFLVRSTVL
jgi:hypothetical protein